ncbi:MAG: hypothetical protein CR986_03280 [Ignavibacteriae bacterium]|nr:MAG: hypothetical protein CR986_03280 [Ignavibacteriota bacterium]
MEDGTQLGPFYELETSSAVKELKPNEAIEHIHKTYHFEGSFEELNKISQNIFKLNFNHIYFGN